jgi:hypothetical protein
MMLLNSNFRRRKRMSNRRPSAQGQKFGATATNASGGIVSIGNYRLSTTLGIGSFGKVKRRLRLRAMLWGRALMVWWWFAVAEHIITGHQVRKNAEENRSRSLSLTRLKVAVKILSKQKVKTLKMVREGEKRRKEPR